MPLLTEEERRRRQALAREGAMSPVQAAVRTMVAPDQTAKELRRLLEEGYLVAQDVKGLEKEVYALTARGKRALAQE